MSRQIQLRRGTAPDWTTSNPVLAQGEIGYETDTNKFKIGDGSSAWSALSYFTQSQSGSDIVSAINGSAGVIDDDNIASTIARDSEVSSAISTHAGNATAHHSNVNDPSTTEKAALAGTSGTPSGTNKYVTNDDSRMTDSRYPTAHAHGNITNAGAIGSTANLPVITTTSGVLTVGSFGSSANTFCVGNDSRLSDSRTPTSHNNSAHSETYITAAGVTYEQLNTNGDVGTTSGTLCAGDDARLVTNAKQADRPFVFQTGHTAWATGLSNEEIGRIQLQTGETLYIKRVEIQIKGGGTSASLSVNAYDSTNTTTIASQTAGGVNTTGGNSGSAALVLIRLTNSVGSTQNASVYISGWIRS